MHASNTYIATAGAHYSYDVAGMTLTCVCIIAAPNFVIDSTSRHKVTSKMWQHKMLLRCKYLEIELSIGSV